MVKILKLDNPKRSYTHLTVLKSGEIGFEIFVFIIGSIANWVRNHQNYTIVASNFDLKLSHYILNT